jgi:hypothetical protein
MILCVHIIWLRKEEWWVLTTRLLRSSAKRWNFSSCNRTNSFKFLSFLIWSHHRWHLLEAPQCPLAQQICPIEPSKMWRSNGYFYSLDVTLRREYSFTWEFRISLRFRPPINFCSSDRASLNLGDSPSRDSVASSYGRIGAWPRSDKESARPAHQGLWETGYLCPLWDGISDENIGTHRISIVLSIAASDSWPLTCPALFYLIPMTYEFWGGFQAVPCYPLANSWYSINWWRNGHRASTFFDSAIGIPGFKIVKVAKWTNDALKDVGCEVHFSCLAEFQMANRNAEMEPDWLIVQS